MFETDDLVGQIEQTLKNILAVLAAADAGPEHLVSLTWYLTDLEDYAANQKAIGRVWSRRRSADISPPWPSCRSRGC